MPKELAKTYDPREVEDRTYAYWEQGGFFRADPDPEKKPYTIVIPPPNITGQLHMGHALNNTLQDILIRWRRMQGFETLWLPGTDHASIATEAKLVEALRNEGLTKEEIGREKYLERAWDWNDKYGSRIVEQLKKMGFSCDWSRRRFTLDGGCNKAVNEVFVKLYEKGLIYRGERIINWCPKCLTTISDAEVDHAEKEGSFWHIIYPLTDGSGHMELATTRPETMLGDTAVAVHPDDPRYQKYIGKTVTLPLVNREIPVIADSYVEPEFGTGVVKITPAHDPNDFEVGLRHGLPVVNVMTQDGKINQNGGKFEGLDRYAARKQIVKELEELGLLPKIQPMKHNVGACYRCSTVVEPRVSLQWFVNMQPLAEPAVKAVREQEVRFVPERFNKIYFNWMDNIRDWCISRQLWWGHRIPAWYCADCGEITVAADAPDGCGKCKGQNLQRDPDTLDTWFSSALWPFSTLGWPEQTEDLKYFYPTNTLVTSYDIIFFWVARMIFSGLEHVGEIPFDTVFIHGLVRDDQGRKMSKSLGNGVEPLEVIAGYGADALRFTLATGNSPGNDMRFSEKRVESSRNFANKLWNAARFILMNLDEDQHNCQLSIVNCQLELEDKWVISKLNNLTAEVTENLEKFELGLAVQKLYDFIWDIFCDWYIELSKTRLKTDRKENALRVLIFVMSHILKLLHPFMPFITEEIWQSLPGCDRSIMISDWPKYREALNFAAEEREFERIMAAIRAVRNRRAEMNVPPGKKTRLFIATVYPETFSLGQEFIKKLAYANEVSIAGSFELEQAVSVITADATVYIPLGELIDFEAERARLNKEKEAVQKQMTMIQTKLSNPGFLAKAPEKVVAGQREMLSVLKEKLQNLEKGLEAL